MLDGNGARIPELELHGVLRCDRAEGLALTRMVGDVYLFVIYNTVEAFARLYLGEWGRVREMVASALAISERNVNVQASVLCRLTIAWLHVEAQEFESARKARRGNAQSGRGNESVQFLHRQESFGEGLSRAAQSAFGAQAVSTQWSTRSNSTASRWSRRSSALFPEPLRLLASGRRPGSGAKGGHATSGDHRGPLPIVSFSRLRTKRWPGSRWREEIYERRRRICAKPSRLCATRGCRSLHGEYTPLPRSSSKVAETPTEPRNSDAVPMR